MVSGRCWRSRGRPPVGSSPLEAIEGDGRRRSCVLRAGPCGTDGFCDVHDVFFAAQDALLDMLAGARLTELSARRGGHLPDADERSRRERE